MGEFVVGEFACGRIHWLPLQHSLALAVYNFALSLRSEFSRHPEGLSFRDTQRVRLKQALELLAKAG